jgi:hypothetical protein
MDVTTTNKDIIKYQIQLKQNEERPYFISPEITKSISTRMNHYPYTNFFQGRYNSSDPIVFDRESGYNSQTNKHVKEIVLAQKDPIIRNKWQYSSDLISRPYNNGCLYDFI